MLRKFSGNVMFDKSAASGESRHRFDTVRLEGCR